MWCYLAVLEVCVVPFGDLGGVCQMTSPGDHPPPDVPLDLKRTPFLVECRKNDSNTNHRGIVLPVRAPPPRRRCDVAGLSSTDGVDCTRTRAPPLSSCLKTSDIEWLGQVIVGTCHRDTYLGKSTFILQISLEIIAGGSIPQFWMGGRP